MIREDITIGSLLPQSPGVVVSKIRDCAPALAPYLHRQWFRSVLSQQCDLQFRPDGIRGIVPAQLTDDSLARHTLAVGTTGSGKSRMTLHLLVEELRRGCSVVLIDPKGETADHLLTRTYRDQLLSPEDVIILDPREAFGVPGWNPLGTATGLTQTVGDLVAVIEACSTSWGPRLADLLTNVLIVAGAHHLSLVEGVEILRNDAYRDNLLALRPSGGETLAYLEAVRYLREEFGVWSRSQRSDAIAPVLNKLRELLRSEFLRPLLTSRRNTLELSELWRRQKLVVVRLDRAALGDLGMRLLAGLLTNLIYRTACRRNGAVPVVLALDELPVIERFVGVAVSDILTTARSMGLRLLVAMQHLNAVTDGLRETLLALSEVQIYFRLGDRDAQLVGRALSSDHQRSVREAILDIDQHHGRSVAVTRLPIVDSRGRPLRVTPGRWHSVSQDLLFSSDPVLHLSRIAAGDRLYVRTPDGRHTEVIHRAIAGLSPSTYVVEGPVLSLAVTHPRPKLTAIERQSEADHTRAWTACLQRLPVQHAVLRVGGAPRGVVRVVDVPVTGMAGGSAAHYTASTRWNGQSKGEIAACNGSREREIERIAHGMVGLEANEDESNAW